MAKKKFTPADLAAQFGMTKEEVEVAPQPKPQAAPKAEPQSEQDDGKKPKKADVPDSPALDKPQEGEVAIYMELDKIHPHPKNRRMRSEVKLVELAKNIEEVGLLEFPLAWVNPQGECELLSGHHRWVAYKWLRDNVDAQKYAKMPVRFREDIDSEGKALRILYSANFYNEDLLPSERAQSAAFIYEDIDTMRKSDESLAGVRSANAAADILQTTARTVSRLVRIHRNLIDGIKELWDKDIITQTQAEDLSGLSFVYQEEFYRLAKDYPERLTRQQFNSIRSKAVGVDLDRRKVGRPKDPNKQLRTYVQSVVKKGREMKKWRDMGGTVDQNLIENLKAIVKMLEE